MYYSQKWHYSGSQMNGHAPTLMLPMFLHIFFFFWGGGGGGGNKKKKRKANHSHIKKKIFLNKKKN